MRVVAHPMVDRHHQDQRIRIRFAGRSAATATAGAVFRRRLSTMVGSTFYPATVLYDKTMLDIRVTMGVVNSDGRRRAMPFAAKGLFTRSESNCFG